MGKIKHRYPLQYEGSIIILILCYLIFFPIGIALTIKNMRFLKQRDNKYYKLVYRGSFGWLAFWIIIFFPVALIMILLKGMDIVEYGTKK